MALEPKRYIPEGRRMAGRTGLSRKGTALSEERKEKE